MYNNEKYLLRTLDSINRQTYTNIEVLISDNCSTDKSLGIAKEFSKDKDNWTILENSTNIGAINNWNKLIDNALGELIAIYHADDVYHESIVQESVNEFITNSKISFIGTSGQNIDNNGNFISEYSLPANIRDKDKNINKLDDLFLGIVTSNSFQNEIVLITPSVMVKKAVYEDVGTFNSIFKSSCDYEMWFRISLKYSFSIINKKLISYRNHPEQWTQSAIRDNIKLPDLILVMEHYKENIKNENILSLYLKYIDRLLLITAVKQNNARLFTISSNTLDDVTSIKGLIYKRIIKLLNLFSIRISYDLVRNFYNKIDNRK